jgi:phosphate:Na+ symporter
MLSDPDHLTTVKNALKETRRFLGTVPSFSTKSEQFGDRVAVIHAWDHLTQLAEVIGKAPKPALPDAVARLEGPKRILVELLDQTESGAEPENANWSIDAITNRSQQMAELRRRERVALLEETAHLSVDPGAAARVLKGLRWFDAVGYHLWRASHHLVNIDSPDQPENRDPPDLDEFAISNTSAAL